MAAHRLVLAFEFASDPWAAISLTAQGVSAPDEGQKLAIGLLALAGLALQPRIIAAARDCKESAEPSERKFHRLSFHLGIPFCDGSSESMPRDFFRISRCWVTRSSSRRKRWFSSSSSAALPPLWRCVCFQNLRAASLTPSS